MDSHEQPIIWERADPPLDDDAIAAVEKRLRVKLPPDYIAVARYAHGGQPSRSGITVPDARIGDFGSSMSLLLSLAPRASEGIFAVMRMLGVDRQLPRRVIPFGADAGGDYFCFDYRKSGPTGLPTVCYFAHEKARNESLIPLASSFSELLDRFEEVTDRWSPSTK